jgi:hypothetical protein
VTFGSKYLPLCKLGIVRTVRVVLGKLSDVAMVARAAAAERELSLVDPTDESEAGWAQHRG